MLEILSPTRLYRLPWNLADNSISWLEPTSKCNIYCDGCYRENRMYSHKTLSEIEYELDVFERLRKTDTISIAGGEPLLHPNIIDIVQLIKRKRWKPNINTNGILLEKDLIKELKKAGLHSFTIHIDSGQNRPGWKGKNESELNELRTKYADMIYDVGGITTSFNATVYPETIQYINEILDWAQKKSAKVHGMVFIIYRMAVMNKDYDFYLGDKKVEFEDITYSKNDDNRRIDISAEELVGIIREKYPDFTPCAYLNGTHKADSYKWLLSCRFLNRHKIFGYPGPFFMELIQTFTHLFTGSYLSYASSSIMKKGRLNFLLSPFDKGVRSAAKNYLKSFFLNYKAFFSRVNVQTVLLIQPADFMPDGSVNMCDGCPDMTVWNGELVWSCRLEEQFRWGQNIRLVPKSNIEVVIGAK